MPKGGRNGTAFQTGAEFLRHENYSGGLIKLLYFDNSENALTPSTAHTTALVNIGLVVPDLRAAEERLSRYGVPIAKRVGSVDVESGGPVAIAWNIGPTSTFNESEAEELVRGFMSTDLEILAFVEEPNGNMIEIVEQKGF